MKFFLLLIFFLFKFNTILSEDNLLFYIESAYKNNPRLNAERKNLEAIKQNVNISRSEFLPSVTISGNKSGSQSTGKTNQAGDSLSDSSTNTESKTVSVDQKIFQGFQGYNSLKKSNLEVKQANYELIKIEQKTILNSAEAYFDLIFKDKNKKFNIANKNIFERQVETDQARLQKGEISLTDLAQSESSLAGANANMIIADTELLTSKMNFERITRVSIPEKINLTAKFNLKLPKNLSDALKISNSQNPKLLIARVNYQIADKDLNIEKSKISPSASVNYSKTKNNDFNTTIDKVDQETVKATVSWPLIKGGKNYSSVKKSKFKKEQSNLILTDVENEIKTEVTNAWSIFQSAEGVLRATESQLQAAEIANEGITLEYDSGSTRTTLEVIQSRSLLLNARISQAKAVRDFTISQFKLLEAIGDLTLENINSFKS
jgi:outer membrane protein|tara:strand:+ start:1078 stop:2379 length:1302 start_codon:yes stop_codon:yes gene_type:complete